MRASAGSDGPHPADMRGPGPASPAWLLALALSAIGIPRDVPAETFRFAFQGNLNALDPYALNETFTFGQLGNVYEGLVKRDRSLQIVPGLAQHWESIEPTRWRFHLRRGVVFADGSPFTAADVVFSAGRVRRPGSDFKTRLPADAEVLAVDDLTVDFVLSAPNPILPYEWDSWYIMSRAWAQAQGALEPVSATDTQPNPAAFQTNGTGPFVIVSHQPGVRTVYEPNPRWWGQPQHNLSRAIFTPIPADATRVAALLSGEVDMIDPVPLQDMARVEAHTGTRILTGPELRTVFFGFDQFSDELASSNVRGRNPFKDVRVRRAFYQAIDISLIVERVMRGRASSSALMISPALLHGAAGVERYPFDPAESRRLLAEAGYPEGFAVTLDCPNDRYVNDEAICQAVVGFLARIGIAVRLVAQPKARYFARVLQSGGYDTDFYLLGYTPGSFDSYSLLHNLMNCRDAKGLGSPLNLGGYCNLEVDRLTRAILVENDHTRRDAAIVEAFAIAHADVAYIPLHQQALAWGVADRVAIVQRPDNQIILDWVRIGD